MNKAAFTLSLPQSLKSAAERLAREDGVSLEQWVATAVAQKVGAVEPAAAFFGRRAARAVPGGLLAVLDKVPDVPPEPHDRLPPDLEDALREE